MTADLRNIEVSDVRAGTSKKDLSRSTTNVVVSHEWLSMEGMIKARRRAKLLEKRVFRAVEKRRKSDATESCKKQIPEWCFPSFWTFPNREEKGLGDEI
jgi:hypothetical protein